MISLIVKYWCALHHKIFGEPKTDPKLFKLNELSGGGWEKDVGWVRYPLWLLRATCKWQKVKDRGQKVHTNQTKPN